MKINIIVSLLLLLCIGWFVIVIKDISDTENKFKSNMGKKFVLEKDTLLIVDYSIWSNNFTLSNGKVVNSELILNKK